MSINSRYDVYLNSGKGIIAIVGKLPNEVEYYKEVFSLAAKHFEGSLVEKKVSLSLKNYGEFVDLIYEIPRKSKKIIEFLKEEIDSL